MKNDLTKIAFACCAALTLLAGSGAAMSAPRTFVASSGLDTNSCSLVQPCRTFANAPTKTSAGGEVIVLDSAGYGPLEMVTRIFKDLTQSGHVSVENGRISVNKRPPLMP